MPTWIIPAIQGLIQILLDIFGKNPPSALASQDELDTHAAKIAAWESWLKAMPKA
jgi:hypothetical protein